MSASPQPWIRPLRSLLMAAAAAAALVACGSDDDSTTPTATPADTLSGVAAVGSPIVDGLVSISCAGGAGLSATTNTSGAWNVPISGQTLPCAVRVNGGTVDGVANALSLHSLAFDFSNVNLTPLTDLIVARAVAGDPQAWFNAPTFTALTAASVNAAAVQIVNALGIAAALGERNPMVATFQPQAGDAIDDVLEALRTALQTLGTDFAALLAAAGANNFADFAGLANAIATAQAGSGGSTGGSCTSGVQMTFDSAGGGANGPFTNGQKACVEASSTSLKIGSLMLSNPTTNTVVTAPYSAYIFTDAGLNYEVVFNNAALYEINIGKPNALSIADFHGQFKLTAASGGVTLTVEVAISGATATSFTVPNQTPPAGQTEFCADPASNPNLLGLQAQNGISLAITGCSFAGNVGTIQATATAFGSSVPYVVRFIYGS